MKFFSFLFIFVFSAHGSTTLAAANCLTAFQGQNAVAGEPHTPLAFAEDTPIEIEPVVTPTILNLLTTSTGTAAPVLEKIPKEKRPRWIQPSALWENLLPSVQLQLLKDMAWHEPLDYDKERTAHALRVRDHVRVHLAREMKFMGQSYGPGTHVISLKGLFGEVEYCCNNNGKKNLDRVELHFRPPGISAGESSRELHNLEALLETSPSPQHAHILAPLPVEKMAQDPFFYSLWMMDHHRRVNLTAELLAVYHGLPIRNVISRVEKIYTPEGVQERFHGIYFSYLRRADLPDVTRFFYQVATANDAPTVIRPPQRMGAALIQKEYDNPLLYGIEYRLIMPQIPAALTQAVLDAVQKQMLMQDYGLKKPVSMWLENSNAGTPRSLETHMYLSYFMHYNAAEMDSHLLSPALLNLEKSDPSLTAHIERYSENHQELRMLKFSWITDTLILEDLSRLTAVMKAQDLALRLFQAELTKNKNPTEKEVAAIVSKTMRKFIEKSGLLKYALQSLGVDTDKIQSDAIQ